MTREQEDKFFKEQKIRIAEDQECIFQECLEKGLDSFKFELRENLKDHEIYKDMAPQYSKWFDRTFFASYLELGIIWQVRWIAEQIMLKDQSKYSPETIAKMIRCNYHLHNAIKTDLLNNLKIYSGFDGYKI